MIFVPCQKEDLYIDRKDGKTYLYNADGETLAVIVGDLTNDQCEGIRVTLNRWFLIGYNKGQEDKINEIKLVLDIPKSPKY